ncbi:MAG TPA: DUF924 family protein [Arenibaculum sp.]|nr:DUF924 family protein [Arenibaculum sp.]
MTMIEPSAERACEPTADAARTGGILDYWFGELGDLTLIEMQSDQCRRWYGKDPATDAYVRDTWLGEYKFCLTSKDYWSLGTARDWAALVILFDQFPRNMFRDTPAMYEADPLALGLCLDAIDRKLDQELPLIQRMFLYMPLMHSEELAMQDRMLALFEALPDQAGERCPQNVGFFEMARGFARQHHHIVARFGRFPHRNAILGRATTAEEETFLKEPHSSF